MRERIITGATPGYVYLLCWAATPLGNLANPRAMASHYLGWAEDLAGRLAEHAAGRGAALTVAAVAKGITWQVFYRPGTPGLERTLKRRKETPCFCPNCCARRGRRPGLGFVPLDQLLLPLEIERPIAPWPAGFDFPAPTPTRPGWAEWQNERRQRAAGVALVGGDEWDAGLL